MRITLLSVMLATLASASVPAADFEFVVVGDTRPRFESESFRPFESLITKINAAKPALVVNLGDLIYGYGPASKEKQWDKYQSVVREIQAPYYQVPGNHDTHSKESRRIYEQRFGSGYRSFDFGGCHFVLLDNSEEQRWGYISPAQLSWLQRDLGESGARMAFVFLHFPVWEPDRITSDYYQLWSQTLHPLFKRSRVRAVFGGHYHTYGPTREFDGIRYFTTGGGGAELRPEYRKSGGDYHFMKVSTCGDSFDVRVVTERGELTDPEADVMGGLQFAARNVSRIGIRQNEQDLRKGVAFSVSVENPSKDVLKGQAAWLMDTSAFSVEPSNVVLVIPGGTKRQYRFNLKALQEGVTLQSLPQMVFDVVAGGKRHRFHREVRFVHQATAPYRKTAPALNDNTSGWEDVPALTLREGTQPEAQLRSCYNEKSLYLAVAVPSSDDAEAKELGFTDELQIGLALPLNESDFGRDLLRLGINADSVQPRDRTPGHKAEVAIPGARSAASKREARTCYEVTIPMSLLRGLKVGPGARVILDLSFLVPENEQLREPGINTLSYRVRYGSDSLIPVFFVELELERAP